MGLDTENQHEEGNEKECRFCHNHNITDDWVYCCPSCGAESCPDCAGRCGCDVEEEAPGE